MKHFLLTLLLSAAIFGTSFSRTLTAVANGAWDATSTWSPNYVPQNGDLVVIPSGKTVSINTNENMRTSKLDLRIAGDLKFVGGGSKLWIDNQSVIFIYPTGKIQATQNSQSITIGTTDVMNATNSGVTITGPSVARSSSTTNNTSNSTAPTGFSSYSPAALPVKFVAFTATRRASEVLVQWSTAEEQDALNYEIELSQDGRNWNTVGTEKAAGTTNLQHDYRFMARNLPSGTLQFRIKQIDIDGKFTYTATRTVKAGLDGSIHISASAGRVLLQFGEEVKGATVRIMNLNGQVMQEQPIASALGQVLISSNQKGLCIIAIVTENEIAATQKVVL